MTVGQWHPQLVRTRVALDEVHCEPGCDVGECGVEVVLIEVSGKLAIQNEQGQASPSPSCCSRISVQRGPNFIKPAWADSYASLRQGR